MAICQSRLQQVLYYNQETGVFVNKIRRSNCHIGKQAGCINASGYIKIAIDGQQYLGHRLAWLYMYGEIPEQIDHVNGNRSDNRISNLRPCNQALNTQNIRTAHCDNSCGLLGVEFIKDSGRYRARIMVNGKAKHLGCFTTAQEAHRAYLIAKANMHEFSTLSIKE